MIQEVPGQVSFKQAFKDFFRGYFDFKGRSTRAGYWWVNLIFVIVELGVIGYTFQILLRLISEEIGMNLKPYYYFSIGMIGFLFAILIPALALAVRRYRDAGLTGRGMAVLFILLIALLLAFYDKKIMIQLIMSITTTIIAFFPTNFLTIRSENKLLRFFFRGKEEGPDTQNT